MKESEEAMEPCCLLDFLKETPTFDAFREAVCWGGQLVSVCAIEETLEAKTHS